MIHPDVKPSDGARNDAADRARSRAEELGALARQERMVVYAIFSVLAVVTVVFWGANYYAIRRSRSLESPLSLEVRAALEGSATLGARVVWLSTPERAGVHPIVLVGGDTLPAEIDVAPAHGQGVHLAGVSVLVPRDLKPGSYQGRLLIEAPGDGVEREATEWAFPLSLEVPGAWEEWSLLRGWLIVLAVVLGAVYCFLAYWFPGPRGTLTVRIAADGTDPRSRISLPLRSGLSGWLRPWTRSTLRLDRTLRDDTETAAAADWFDGMALEFTRFGFGLVLVRLTNESDTPVYVTRGGVPLPPDTARDQLMTTLGSRVLGSSDYNLELIVPDTPRAATLGGHAALSYLSLTDGF